ncbi:MAG: ABC transporter ATP-binding protein [Opitutaceae bacterium]
MSAHVVVRQLSKRYGVVDALREVSFEIQQGEIFGLLGPNGAGKTTALECLVGLREPDTGEIVIGETDVRRAPAEARQRIGVALQSTALQDKITPREALALFGSFYREREAPGVLLERFALLDKADAPFDSLSGGQKQRLALALAFVNRPHLVLLDEPTTGLDPHARRELHHEIIRMKQEGYTVLLTTHYLEEAEQLCDRIAILHEGRVIAMGAPRELIAGSSTLQTVTLVASRPIAEERLRGLPGLESLRCDGTTAYFRTGSTSSTLTALLRLLDEQHVEVIDLQVRKATLEDVFLDLTRGTAMEKPAELTR